MAEQRKMFMDLGTMRRKKTLDRTMSLDNRRLSEMDERAPSFDSHGVFLDPLLPQHLWAHGQHMLQRKSGCNRSQGQMKGRVMYKKFLVLSNIKRKSWPSLCPSRIG